MLIRRSESAQTLKGHPQYIHRVGVAIPLLEPTEQSLPLGKETETLNQIEDALSAAFETEQASLQVLTITTNSMREFIYYTRIPAEILAKLDSIRGKFPDYELQCYIAEDKGWIGYMQFA